ncbi:MAG: Serine/threonine protein kinase PrkC, regulator of stationary phase, partial [Myxococcaceae bacterium]|nr:Serine/threonine protein kinase PrkC, regulator of stationary phase [Myxococcaceae bacterium]
MKQEALVGRTIAGKYCLETIVGEGAMGAVYRARQTTLGTTLAIKVLHRQLAGEPMFAARFLREAQAASRVDHPSSMRVIDFGEEPDGLLYIAMEYVDGKTLAKIIEEASPLPVARIVDIACQALAALAVAHDLGVIHRDLKPENIMVLEGEDDEGRTHDIVKVCDFGVAKLLESGSRAPSVTAQGVVVGTPEYMSPEQARGDALDARSDIYAMGVLLFHLMTGKVPFDSSTAFGTAFMHVNDEPTRPRLLNPGVDSRLEAICLKAMRKRPEDRFASARELRSELRALLGHDDAYSQEEAAMDPMPLSGGLLQQIEARPRRTGLVMAGVVLAASVVAAAILIPRPGAAPATAAHEPVQTATITSGVMPVAKAPVAPAQVVDTTDPSSPGADTNAAPAPAPASASKARGVTKVHAHVRRPVPKTHGGDAAAAPAEIAIGVDAIPPLPAPKPAPAA